MLHFDEVYAIAADRKGGAAALEAQLVPPASAADLVTIANDRWLAGMTKSIFQAGFNWKVVDAMWPGFEDAFEHFDPNRCAMLHDGDFDRLVSDTRIIRNGAKIKTVQENAVMVCNLVQEYGSAGAFFANWPTDDFAGLLSYLKKNGSRLGGTTSQYFLRQMGCDSFLLSASVTNRLIAERVIEKPGVTSAKQLKAIQEAFNTWRDQSGRSLKEVSRVLALSID